MTNFAHETNKKNASDKSVTSWFVEMIERKRVKPKKITSMKKLLHILALAAMVALPFAMVSCEDDPWHDPYGPDEPGWDGGGSEEDDAYTLANLLVGKWNGAMTFYEEQTDGSLQPYSFNTNMVFYTNSTQQSLSGSGYEVDYNDTVTADPLYFTWRIDASTLNIYITFTNADKSQSTYVVDFGNSQHSSYIDENNFNGYMLAQNSSSYIVFDFKYVNSQSGAKRSTSTALTNALKTFGTAPALDDLLKTGKMQVVNIR